MITLLKTTLKNCQLMTGRLVFKETHGNFFWVTHKFLLWSQCYASPEYVSAPSQIVCLQKESARHILFLRSVYLTLTVIYCILLDFTNTLYNILNMIPIVWLFICFLCYLLVLVSLFSLCVCVRACMHVCTPVCICISVFLGAYVCLSVWMTVRENITKDVQDIAIC